MSKRFVTNRDLSIRPADPGMISEVHSFLKSVFSPPFYGVLSLTLNELEARASKAGCDVVCMYSQGQLIASLLVEWRNGYVYADLFGVDRAHRGLGIPKLMLAWLEDECTKRGLDRIEFETLDCLPELHRFYEGLGFVRRESFRRHGELLRNRRFAKSIDSIV